MALQVTNITREFSFAEGNKKKVNLSDPGNHLSPEEVQKYYANQFPALTNAMLEGPKTEGGKAIYSFTTKAGKLG